LPDTQESMQHTACCHKVFCLLWYIIGLRAFTEQSATHRLGAKDMDLSKAHFLQEVKRTQPSPDVLRWNGIPLHNGFGDTR
jgi:hypothetical protein